MNPGDLGRAVEEHGFESLLFPDHTHIPVNRPRSRRRSGEMPAEYRHIMDPFVSLAAAATRTTHLLVGTGVCLIAERDPITLAKQVASLDHLSGGRVLFGIGGGWNREEMENHGTDFRLRWKILRERIEAMKKIWMEDEATYHGDFVNFEAIWSWPKPVQKPHPPIIVGGSGPRTLQRVVRYGDEWMPSFPDWNAIGDKIRELNDMAAAANRCPISVSLFDPPSEPAQLEQYRKWGVSRVVFRVPAAGPEVVCPKLDELAELSREFG